MNCLQCKHNIDDHTLSGCHVFGFGMPRCTCNYRPSDVASELAHDARHEGYREGYNTAAEEWNVYGNSI